MRLSFDRLWVWIAIALPAFVALVVPLPAVDLAYQVRAGNEILASGAIPRSDTWTFTVSGTPWVDQQWLAQVLLAAGHTVGGWELLAIGRALLVAGSTGILVAVARARGASPRAAAILALAAFALAAPALALRPQLVGIVLFAIVLWLVAVRHRRPRLYLVAPLVVALWANVHGSFVLGPALLGYAWLSDVAAGRPSARSLAVFVAGTLATLLNPFLAGAWLYAAGIGANPAIAGQVSEWQRTSPLEMPGLLFYPSVALTVGLMARNRHAVAWPDWLLAAGMALIGAWAVRGVPWWAFAMVFLLGSVLAVEPGTARAPGRGRAPRASVANAILAIVLGVLVVAALPWWRPTDPLAGRMGLLTYAPSGLAAEVASLTAPGLARPAQRILVPQTWASWFEWAAPNAAYFIDSRFELFPAEVWADEAALSGPGAAGVLDRWAMDAVVEPTGRPMPPGDWDVRYSDQDGTLYVRRR